MDKVTYLKYRRFSSYFFHFRVRRLHPSHLDPMPEGFVPTSYIEVLQLNSTNSVDFKTFQFQVAEMFETPQIM